MDNKNEEEEEEEDDDDEIADVHVLGPHWRQLPHSPRVLLAFSFNI